MGNSGAKYTNTNCTTIRSEKSSEKPRSQSLSRDSKERRSSSSVSSKRSVTEERPKLTEEQLAMIVETWKIVQDDMSKVGVVLFMHLFETHPEVQNVFIPFKGMTMDDLRYSTELKAHALRVMGAVEKALARIHDPEKLLRYLRELGMRHRVSYNVKAEYIDLVGPQFLSAIEPALSPYGKWTPQVEQAWTDLFRFIAYEVKEAMHQCDS